MPALILTFIVILAASLTAFAAPAKSTEQVTWDGDAVLTGGAPGHIYIQSDGAGGYELVLKDVELSVSNNAIVLIETGAEYKIKISGDVIINSTGNNGIYTDNDASVFAVSIESDGDVVISGANAAIWVGLRNGWTQNTADLSIKAAGDIKINPGTAGGSGILATGSVSLEAEGSIEIKSGNTGVYADTGDIDITADTVAVESGISSGISAPHGLININAQSDVKISAENNSVHGDKAAAIVSGGAVAIETKTAGTPAVISLSASVKVKADSDIDITAAGAAVHADGASANIDITSAGAVTIEADKYDGIFTNDGSVSIKSTDDIYISTNGDTAAAIVAGGAGGTVSIDSGRNIKVETKDATAHGDYGIIADSSDTTTPSVVITVGREGLIRGGVLAVKAHTNVLGDTADDPIGVTDDTKKQIWTDTLWSGDTRDEVTLAELNDWFPGDPSNPPGNPYILITPPQRTVTFGEGRHGSMDPLYPKTLPIYSGDSLTAGDIPVITPNGGYAFIGWKSSVDDNIYTDLTNMQIVEDVTFTAQYVLIVTIGDGIIIEVPEDVTPNEDGSITIPDGGTGTVRLRGGGRIVVHGGTVIDGDGTIHTGPDGSEVSYPDGGGEDTPGGSIIEIIDPDDPSDGLNIIADPKPPKITSDDNTSVVVGEGGTFAVTTTGSESISYSLGSDAPEGVSIDPSTGIMTISDTTAIGTHVFTIKARNVVGFDEQIFTLNVLFCKSACVATVNVKLNGNPWENRDIELTPNDAVFIRLNENAAGIYQNNVSYGIYAIYADGVDTGKTIEITGSSANEATLNFYTLTLYRGAGVESVSRSGVYQAETPVSISASLRNGYTWSKWAASPAAFGDVADKDTAIIMPDYPLTLTAKGETALSLTYSVKIIVLDEDGEPKSNIAVTLGSYSGTTGPNGSLVITVPPGSYALELPDFGYNTSLEVDMDITVVITTGESSLGGNLYSRFSHENGVWVDNDDLYSVYRYAQATPNNDDTLGVTGRDYGYYEDGGDITIYLVATEVGVEQYDERDEVLSEIDADGKEGRFVLDLSAYKDAVDKDGNYIYYNLQLKELNGLVKVHIFLETEHQGFSGYAVYRHHEGVVERIPQKPGSNSNGECFEMSADGTEVILYIKKFSVYAVAYDIPGNDFTRDDVSITNIIVNNLSTERNGDDFSVIAACGEDKAFINVGVVNPNTMVIINGVEQNPRTVDLPYFGDNYITITVRAPNGVEQNYRLIVNRRVPWDQIVAMRWNNTLSIINNPDNNGGFSFVKYRWFRNPNNNGGYNWFSEGLVFETAQWWSAGAQGQLLDTINWYEAEGTTASGNRLRTCPHQIRHKVLN